MTAKTEGTRPAPLRTEFPVSLTTGMLLRQPNGTPPRGGHPALLCLHGYGDDAARLDGLLAPLHDAPYARLFLDAPFPVHLKDPKGGLRLGRSWYAYDGDQARFMESLAFAERLLKDAATAAAAAWPIDPTRIVLLGYSQGGYVAGVAAFRDRARYRGLVGVACRVKTEALKDELAAARDYPALLVHGRNDEHTAFARQEEAVADLRSHGVAAELLAHEGGHGLRREFVPKIDAFVRRVFGFAAAPEAEP